MLSTHIDVSADQHKAESEAKIRLGETKVLKAAYLYSRSDYNDIEVSTRFWRCLFVHCSVCMRVKVGCCRCPRRS